MTSTRAVRHRAKGATSAVVAILCAACTSVGPTAPTDDLTNAAAAVGIAVEPPGPLDGALWGDDLLIVGSETLPRELVDRIEAVEVDGRPGVAAAEQFSLGQISIEGRVLDLAAVDPGSFRRFTAEDAHFQEQWDRVANGEIAVAGSLDRRLPLDDGYLRIGTGHGELDIHVGAYSTYQVGTIDVLVNEPRGEQLGVPRGNALLLSTGLASPQAVRAEVERLAPDLSISALDIVAETGIDPGTSQSVTIVGSFEDAVGDFSYTATGDGRVIPEPAWVEAHIATEDVPILGSVTCNRAMLPQLNAALAEIQAVGLADRINPGEYAGCYYPRFIAGTTTLSNHAFGLAFDVNVPGNQRGTAGEIDRRVVAIFKRWGFAWGGDWNYTDPMHFELQRIVDPT